MAELDAGPTGDQEVGGGPPLRQQHSFVAIDHEIFSYVIIIIIRFLINVQVQGQQPHQWSPFQIAGLLHA